MPRLGFWLALGISGTTPAAAYAAEAELAPAPSALPPPPPPANAAPATDEALPPAPAPRSVPIPPGTASAVSGPVAPSAAPPGAPGSDLPAPPRPPRGTQLHDGFYLRMAVGLGFGGALVSSDSTSIGDYDFGGGAGAADLWVGGTPASGLAMGAALSGLALDSSKRSVGGNQVSGDVAAGTGILGYFVDFFPNPQRGFHLGGALGFASAAAEVKNSGQKFQGGGLGLQAWGGYDFWVGPQWALGGMLRFIGSLTREERANVGYETSLGALTLSFTALYH